MDVFYECQSCRRCDGFIATMTSVNSDDNKSVTETPSEDDDPVEAMIKRTGCEDVHYKLLVRNFTET